MQTRWKKRIWIYSASAAWLILLAFFSGVLTGRRGSNQAPAFDDSTRQPSKQVIASLPQPFLRILSSMYDHESQIGIDGARHELTQDTGVWASDGMYIYNLCRRIQPERTLEIGLAEGYSTVFFLAALSQNGRGSHVAVDPFEKTEWHGLGLHKVEELGLQQRFRFIEAKSILALPQLASEGSPFQVIFIDGDHKFDAEMADFVLSDSICPKGGFLLFHDIWMASTQKLVSFIHNNRHDYAWIPTGTDIAAFQRVGEDRRDWRQFDNF